MIGVRSLGGIAGTKQAIVLLSELLVLTLVIRFGQVVLVREPAVVGQYAEPHQIRG